MKTQLLKITFVAFASLLLVNTSKAQQYINSSNSSTTIGYACYNFYDNGTAPNITPSPLIATNSIILPAAAANNISVVGSSGSCLASNGLSTPIDAAINYIPNSADQTTYAANLNTQDWEWSLLYRATTLPSQSAPGSGAPGSAGLIYTPLVGTSNNWRYWLHATTSTVTNTTQGFVLMQTSDGLLHVYVADGGTYDKPIELLVSKAALAVNTTYCIKIQRLINGTWNMYLDPYTSTVTQAATLQQTRVSSDGYSISLAYKNSILQASQSSTTAGTYKFDETHMYTRYLYFAPMTTAAQGVTQSPLYAGETPVILYGIQVFTRGNYDFTQIYINETDNSYFRSNFVNNGNPAYLYETQNPVLSMTGATFISNIQLNNGTGAQAQITAYTSPFVSMGNINGSLSNPGNYFIETSMQNPLNVTTGSMSFGTVSSVVDGTTGSPISTGQYANGTPPSGSGTISTGTTYDWIGGTGGTNANSWSTPANWKLGIAPHTTSDVVNIGVNYVFSTATGNPVVKKSTTVGQINFGPINGTPTTLYLDSGATGTTGLTGTIGTSLTATAGITLAAANSSGNRTSVAISGGAAPSGSYGTLITQGTSTMASTSSISSITNANITNTGTFTLNSDANGSAQIGTIGTGGSITGTFNVQRYLTGGSISYRTWRLLSSPIHNASTTTFNFTSLTQNTIVTGGTSANGFDPQPSWGATGYTANGPTVLFYTETNGATSKYTTFTSGAALSSNSKTTGTGFYFYYRGDRTHNLVNKVEPISGVYATPESTYVLWTGTLNQGNVSVGTTYTANAGATQNGYNLIGNPYASTIDWTQMTAANATTSAGTYYKTGSNVYPILWEYDPTINSTNPVPVGNTSNFLSSGQGAFVRINSIVAATGSIKFTEAIKTPSINQTGAAAQFSVIKPQNAYIQFEMIRDSVNADYAYIRFYDTANPKYNTFDDIDDVNGTGQNVFFGSMTADSVEVALNSMPLKKLTSFFLSVNATTQGAFSIKRTDLVNIPSAYDVFLKDHYTNDSVDMRQHDSYAFNITSDPKSFGNSRFEVILRIKPLPAYKLLAFTGQHVSDGNQLNWKTANENYYTTFQLQKSLDEGKTFTSISTIQSDSSGAYTYTDKAAGKDTSMYRLMQSDVNDNITYSSIVIISTTGSLVQFKVYPNPASSYIQFQANSVVNPPLKLNIYNSIGSIVKTTTFSANTGTQDLSGLINGTYILELIDVNTKKSLGTAKFSKF